MDDVYTFPSQMSPIIEKPPFWELGGLNPHGNSTIAWLSNFGESSDALRDSISLPLKGLQWGYSKALHSEHMIQASNPLLMV